MRFNEVSVGEIFDAGMFSLTKEEIMEFASKYDPQYMHIDEEKAENGRFKSIIASGMQTMAETWKLWVEVDYFGDDIIAGLGLNNLLFSHPVFPGDQLSVKVEILSKEQTKEDKGVVTIKIMTINQQEKIVYQSEVKGLVKA
jgi:acyl dehydratase